MKHLIKRIIKNYSYVEEDYLAQMKQFFNDDWIEECITLINSMKETKDTSLRFQNFCGKKRFSLKFTTSFYMIPQSIWPYEIVHQTLPSPFDKISVQFSKFKLEDSTNQRQKVILQEKFSTVQLRVNIKQAFDLQLPQSMAVELLEFDQQGPVHKVTSFEQYNGLIIYADGIYKVNFNYKPRS